MADVSMVRSPKPPTARKTPMTTATVAKPRSSIKGNQQRKPSGSQTSPKAQQTRKATGSQSSSAFQQKRKGSATFQSSPTSQRGVSESSRGSRMADNRRIIVAENGSPVNTSSARKRSGAGELGTHMDPTQKKQKMTDGGAELCNQNAISSSPGHTQINIRTPLQTSPLNTFAAQQLHKHINGNATDMARALLSHSIGSNPNLLPADPSSSPISSSHIDSITHSMWQLAHQNNSMLQAASGYSAMFSQLKLSALAKSNLLPSWWFLREMAVKMLRGPIEQGGRGWNVDDAEMEGQWREACLWAKEAIERSRRAGGEEHERNEQMNRVKAEE
ncbi:hypothetical protein BKA66DRAFT_441186 [Pyrenochaeta sp. MPI-SDFR-AT-0127]|nr:hypothetical protein BKA66DRAFT_441186 [Pyrenochaeta sp. MPI-SDFR-AT-0127]